MIANAVQLALAGLGVVALVWLWVADFTRPGSFLRARRLRDLPESLTTLPESRRGVGTLEFLVATAALFAGQVLAVGFTNAVLPHARTGAIAAATSSDPAAGVPAPPSPPTTMTIEQLAATQLVMYAVMIAIAAIVWCVLQRIDAGRRPVGNQQHAASTPGASQPGPPSLGPGLTVFRPAGRTIAQAAMCLAVTLPICVLFSIVAKHAAALIEGTPPDTMAHETLKALFDSWTSDTASGASLWTRLSPWVVTLCALILAPVFEEVLFRGCLQSGLLGLTRTRWPAILITTGLFTLVHLGASPWYALPGVLALSIALGVAYERTGRLGVPILVHMGFNGVNLAVAAAIAAYGGA